VQHTALVDRHVQAQHKALKDAVRQTRLEIAYKTYLGAQTFVLQTRPGIGQDAKAQMYNSVGKLLKFGSRWPYYTLCFGLFRFFSECFGYISFGLTETSKLAVSIIEAEQPKQTFSFGCCQD
jgi:hypothetical protein